MPAIRAVPDVGFRSPARTRISVVFPAPFGPNSARHSPGASENVTPATARVHPNSRARAATSTIAALDSPVLFAEGIRLELATLARAAQNDISLQLRQSSAATNHFAPMTAIAVLLTG